MSEKMRGEFEAWMHTYDLPPQLDGAVFDNEKYAHSPLFGQFVYDDLSTQRCWAAWQASRAALEVDLPCTFSPNDCGDWAYWADLVDAALKKAGVGVK